MRTKIVTILVLAFFFSTNAQDKKWTLQECVDYAVDHNISIKQQELNNELFNEDIITAKGNFYPSLGASASQNFNFGSYIDNYGGRVSRDSRSNSFGINTGVTLYNGNRNKITLLQAQKSLEAAGFALEMKYNKQGNQATFAWPIAATLAEFFDRLTWFEKVLEWIAYLVGSVACLIILSVLRNSMNERKREFAILRSLGASRYFITNVVLGQSLIISLVGALGSFLVYLIMSGVASHFIREQTGVLLDPFNFDLTFVYVFLVIVLLGLISGIPPAWMAYRVDISKNLRPSS